MPQSPRLNRDDRGTLNVELVRAADADRRRGRTGQSSQAAPRDPSGARIGPLRWNGGGAQPADPPPSRASGKRGFLRHRAASLVPESVAARTTAHEPAIQESLLYHHLFFET